MADRLPTGIDVLDRKLGGGLPAGSLVVYESPPASQGELLLHEFAAARDTLYLTADRTEDAVVDAFEDAAVPPETPDVRYLASDSPLDDGRRLFRNVGESETLIVDPVDALERSDRARYETFLSELQNHMHNTGSVAVLHGLRGGYVPELRDTTIHIADVTFRLRTEISGGDVENSLSVLKFRGGNALDETIKLNLGDRVGIDTSRDIA
ncbi:RAD55 family ATPase [Halarchaeum nitratireducens]|uniref:Recombinase RecA n=1 Tax=Halarchaeum nitratireducens TaxID=489913 RepID=A0A830GBS0_9EURY|nr:MULTISPECIES: transcriptional regulator [Halarchaeum]MBP2250573.1 KaiC/GvpD/RAD55 family RecA-like ATPase [Halarchaeum solikamskense]GGN15376.1 recombinase RecA [Halarchaeum nitratireducens]